MDNFSAVLFVVAVFGAVIGGGIFIRYLLSISAKYRNDDDKVDERVEIIEEFEKREIDVTVVDMQCTASVVGTKSPKAVNAYVVIFESESDGIMKIPVDEDMYFCFDIGMKGRLTLSGNVIYGFDMEE